MGMTRFPHHPSNHPSSPLSPPPTPNSPHTSKALRKARGAALLSLITQLAEAQSLIAQSGSRPPLTDKQRVVAVLPLRKMREERRRPKKLDLSVEREEVDRGEGAEREAPRRVGTRFENGCGQRELRLLEGARQSTPFVFADKGWDLEAQGEARVQNRVLRFWKAMGWGGKVLFGVLLMAFMIVGVVVVVVVRG